MNKFDKQTNKYALTTARLSTTLFLLSTASVRQIHRKRKERTDLLSGHFPGIWWKCIPIGNTFQFMQSGVITNQPMRIGFRQEKLRMYNNKIYLCVAGVCLGSWMKERGIWCVACLSGLMDKERGIWFVACLSGLMDKERDIWCVACLSGLMYERTRYLMCSMFVWAHGWKNEVSDVYHVCLDSWIKNEVSDVSHVCLGSWMKERGIWCVACLSGLMDDRTRYINVKGVCLGSRMKERSILRCSACLSGLMDEIIRTRYIQV